MASYPKKPTLSVNRRFIQATVGGPTVIRRSGGSTNTIGELPANLAHSNKLQKLADEPVVAAQRLTPLQQRNGLFGTPTFHTVDGQVLDPFKAIWITPNRRFQNAFQINRLIGTVRHQRRIDGFRTPQEHRVPWDRGLVHLGPAGIGVKCFAIRLANDMAGGKAYGREQEHRSNDHGPNILRPRSPQFRKITDIDGLPVQHGERVTDAVAQAVVENRSIEVFVLNRDE